LLLAVVSHLGFEFFHAHGRTFGIELRSKSGFIVLPSVAKPLRLAAMIADFGHEDATRKKSSEGA
jgi:hypothetical protein